MFFPVHDRNNAAVTITPWLVWSLIGLNVVVFAIDRLFRFADFGSWLHFVYAHGMVPAAYTQRLAVYHPLTPGSELLPMACTVENTPLGVMLMPLTYAFIHATTLHLVINLWYLRIFADDVEQRIGRAGLLGVYLGAAVVGGLAHAWTQPESMRPVVGASGAVAGVLGAYVALLPFNRVTCYLCPVWFYIRRVDVPAWLMVCFFILLQVVAMLGADPGQPSTAFVTHLAGFTLGLLTAWPWREPAAPAGLPPS